MRKKTCTEWFEKNLKEIANGNSEKKVLNIAVMFTLIAKAGGYDKISDECYDEMLNECEGIAAYWNQNSQATYEQLLASAIKKLNMNQNTINKIAKILVDSYSKNVAPFEADDKFAEEEIHFNDSERMLKDQAVQGIVAEFTDWVENPEVEKYYREKIATKNMSNKEAHRLNKLPKQNKINSVKNSNMKEKSIADYEPSEIYDYISKRIYGQTEAVKAATMFLYNHIKGRKRNVLFAGPTGCGKTEIWRVIKQIYPYIQIVDSTMITMDGWSGGFKIRDIFANMPREEIEQSIVVFDEFDKFCEPLYGGSGTNYSASGQNELLKIIEGAVIRYEADKERKELEFDSSHISFAFCGSFEQMVESKGQNEHRKSIGFGGELKGKEMSEIYTQKFFAKDLVEYANVRNEIAGRINQIVQLYPMTAGDFAVMLTDEYISPIHKLEREYGVEISLDQTMIETLTEDAAKTQMGVRYLQSQIQLKLDEQLFEDWTKKEYKLGA